MTREQIAHVFTEWERQWREDPAKFQSNHDRLAGTSAEYGDSAAGMFISLMAEECGVVI